MNGEYVTMGVEAVNAMMGFICLFMMAVASGFFLCCFLVKKEYRKPCPPPPEDDKANWLWQYVNEEDDDTC